MHILLQSIRTPEKQNLPEGDAVEELHQLIIIKLDIIKLEVASRKLPEPSEKLLEPENNRFIIDL